MKFLAVVALLVFPIVGCGPVRRFEPCRNAQCQICHGTGTFRCTTCMGTGQMKCKGNMFIGACDAGSTQCSTCNGTGLFLGKQCYGCGGRGRKNCTVCGGTGRASCETCGGDGMAECGHWVAGDQQPLGVDHGSQAPAAAPAQAAPPTVLPAEEARKTYTCVGCQKRVSAAPGTTGKCPYCGKLLSFPR